MIAQFIAFRTKWFIPICSFLMGLSTLNAAEVAFTDTTAEHKKKFFSHFSHEVNMDTSYVGGAKAHLGATPFGQIEEQSSGIKYVASTELAKKNLLRLGIDWQRFSFGLPNSIPLPNTLQSASAVLGADMELSENWLMRVEVEPGIYSDFQDIDLEDVNAPAIVGFSYLASDNLQWFFGIGVDARRNIPVIPGVGLRWKFANQWTLMAVLPRPRLQYALTDKLTFYGGGEIKSGTYNVAKNFGDQFNRRNLNNEHLDFTEVRTGVGAAWKMIPGFTLEAEGGAMVYRNFNYHDPKVNVIGTEIAPYGQLALRASF